MKIKFLNEFICVNITLSECVGNPTKYKDFMIKEDDEFKYFDGCDRLTFDKNFLLNVSANREISIRSYTYDDIKLELTFQCFHRRTNSFVCNDLIDVTTYKIYNIRKDQFEIIENNNQ